MKKSNPTTERIKPHANANYCFLVRHYADGHVTYNMERNGKLAYTHFIRTTKAKIAESIKRAAQIAELQMQGLDTLSILNKVYG